MNDYSFLYRFSPNAYSIHSGFSSKTCKTSPINSMENFSKQRVSSKLRKLKLTTSKNKYLGETCLEWVYFSHIIENNKLLKLLQIYSIHNKKIENCLHNAAILIQKCFKGWITRVKCDKIIIEMRKKITHLLIARMCEYVSNYFYNSKSILKSVTKIQSFFKGHKFRQLNQASFRKNLSNNKAIKAFLKVFVAKEKIESQRNLTSQLQKIKENLARIVISKAILKYTQVPEKTRKLGNLRLNDEATISDQFQVVHDKTVSDKSSVSSESFESSDSPLAFNFKIPFLLKSKQVKSPHQPIPVLIEKKRNSQIWIEKIDEKRKRSILVMKNSGSVFGNYDAEVKNKDINEENRILDSRKQRNSVSSYYSKSSQYHNTMLN